MKIETPLLVPVLAALPVCACMAILGVPAYGHGHVFAFRTLFFVTCCVWLVPLTLLQRAMWRREWPWLRMGLVLLATTYAMSIVDALPGQRLAISLGLQTAYDWADLVRGLDVCWLALIWFCAVHAVAAYYLSLQRTRLHLAQAQAAARDAELRALRLQVNPHFLFNSLKHDGRHEHALANELALLDAYLAIEKARRRALPHAAAAGRECDQARHRPAVRLDMIAELSRLTNRDALLRLRDGSVLRASRSCMPALVEALRHQGRHPNDAAVTA